jgi:hypothetical protein
VFKHRNIIGPLVCTLFLGFVLQTGCGSSVSTSSSSETESSGTSGDSGSDGSSATTDTTGPTVSSTQDSSGTSIATDTAVSVNTTFCCLFSEAIDITTCTTSTLQLSCGGSSVTGTVDTSVDSDSITNNECCLNPDSALSQKTSCTFTCTNEIKDTSGNEGTTSQQTATTGCASSDDFSADSSACYEFSNTSNQTNDISNAEAASIAMTGGQLVFDMSTVNSDPSANPNNRPSAEKTVSGDFDIQIKVVSLTADNDDAIVKFTIAPTSGSSTQNAFTCQLSRTQCIMGQATGGVGSTAFDAACHLGGATSANIDLRVVRAGTTFQCFRRLSGGDFVQVGGDITNANLEDTISVEIEATSRSTSGTGEYVLDDLVFNSGGAVGQD